MAMVTVLVGLLLGMTSGSGVQSATPRCVAHATSAHVQAFVELAPIRVTDTIATATICVVSTSAKVGSYHGELRFDTLTARLVSADAPVNADGMRAQNTRESGRIRFAGAAPTGFADATLLTVTLRLRKAGTRPSLHLDMRELNAVDGVSLMPQLVAVPAQ
jgi:hypothetical protein